MRKAVTAAVACGLFGLAGCGDQAPGGGGTAAALSGADKVEAIASTLQACSYDGRPVEATPASLNGAAPNDCALSVKKIMGFTGLPANFVVVSGPVPNAAAVILLDQNRTPRRVIAFNPEFMAKAQALTGGSPWGPVSVMAHEIAHHLSGHTITPGGSRPEIELEADKFSGFVLSNMGAPLSEATRMILAVGSDHASATHPAKGQRVDAIRQGWSESCRQAGRPGCDTGAATAAGTVPPAPPAEPVIAVRALPTPGSIPFKYGRFVIDETGKLDPARARVFDQELYALARDHGAEFTLLVVNDLKGMSAQDYAWAMMRQLRIGKLDVGNGAVAVVAPRQRQAAVAFGPGFAKEAEFAKHDQQLLDWIDAAWAYCDDADGCKTWTDSFASIFRGTLFGAARTKWTIEYQSLRPLMAHYEALEEERARTGRQFDDKVDQPLGTLVRLRGRVTSLKAPTGIGQANERILGGQLGYTAVSLTTDDGLPVILYVSPRLAPLMPAGALKVGTDYTLVGRLQSRGDSKGQQASALWLFSYDPLG